MSPTSANLFTPGSPTPFELGLRGIASALKDVDRELAVGELGTMARAGGSSVTNNYNLTLQTAGAPLGVREEFEIMRSLAGAG